MTQRTFAARVGCSVALLQAIENRKRGLSRDVADRIMTAVGAESKALRDGHAVDCKGRPYSLQSFKEWNRDFRVCDEAQGKLAATRLARQLDALVRAAARQGAAKVMDVELSFLKWREATINQFGLAPHLTGLARDDAQANALLGGDSSHNRRTK